MPKIKILPVYPEFPLTFWSYKIAIEYTNKKASMPPTGLATVLAMLPEKSFSSDKIIDLNVESLSDEKIKNSDLIFTSSMIIQEESHNEIMDRAHFFGKKVVAGGPFPTSYPDRNSRADFIVAGEAEITLPFFLEDLLKGKPKELYTETNIPRNALNFLTKTGKTDITKTPLPRWDLLDLKNYISASIQYSRGCPFDCEFCDITKLYGHEPRTKTSEQMISELESIYNFGHHGSVFIVDDNFIGNKKNVLNLLPHIIDWQKKHNYPFSLFTEASMNLAWPSNNTLLENMVKAGFDSVFLGIESINPEVLKEMNKPQNTLMDQLQAVRKIQNTGLEVFGGFIIGSDKEKTSSFNELFDFIQEAGIVVAMPGLLTALRGTDLYTRLKKEGRIKEESQGNNTHQLGFNFIQQNESDIINGYKQLINKLYSAKNYYDRCRVLQKNQGRHFSARRLNLEGILSLEKSLKRQIFANGGLEYLKYITETALTNPSYFPEAITQAIKLDHFRTITKETLTASDYIPLTENLYNKFIKKAQKISKKYGDNFQENIAYLSLAVKKTIQKAEKRFEKLHKDFRKEAEVALYNLKQQLYSRIEEYKLYQQAE